MNSLLYPPCTVARHLRASVDGVDTRENCSRECTSVKGPPALSAGVPRAQTLFEGPRVQSGHSVAPGGPFLVLDHRECSLR